ncbi:uncharacterized protein LOC134805896 [Cydia splendana]|uniref:uncharacterized protein LOC134805896 n=1 Tax=Cydia splendana TaxID=1100963 RepID=UPI00300C6783
MANVNLFRSPNKQFGSNPELQSEKQDPVPSHSGQQRKRKHLDGCDMDLSNLESEIKNMFADIKSELKSLRSENSTINNSISELKTQQQEILSEFNHMKTSFEFADEKQREHERQMAELTSKVSDLENKHSDYEALNNKYDHLLLDLDRQQQYARIQNLEITGMPESKNENLPNLIISIAKHAGVEIIQSDIEHVTRVRAMTPREGRPRAIVVKLRNRTHKNNILAGLRRTRGISTSDIDLQGESRRLYVNEHLTPSRKQVLKECKTAAKNRGYEYVWVRECNIYARKSDGAPVLAVESLKDLKKLL